VRISVTGTRGKSSIVRMLSSILRQNGNKVIGKITGSEARLILQNGMELDIKRRGNPSIIEQIKLIKMAAKSDADCIVCEIMSIHPENHIIESQRILKPNIVIISNVRCDHIDAMGSTKDEVAEVFCLDIPDHATVFIPQEEERGLFSECISAKRGELIYADENSSSSLFCVAPELQRNFFPEALDLVYAVCRNLNINDKTMIDGLLKVKNDCGLLRIWKYKIKNKIHYLADAFGANDPESTFNCIAKLKSILPSASGKFIGLLNLRSDRGDRTLQWIKILQDQKMEPFEKLFVIDGHARVVKRKLKTISLVKYKQPEKIMECVTAGLEDQSVIFGFGNTKGAGNHLVNYWDRMCEDYGL